MRERVFALDGIRILATLCILTFHFNVLLAQTARAPVVGFLTMANGSMGHIGVSLFFVLSGYSLYLRWEGRFQWKPYAKSRFLSIYPLYWIGFFTLFVYTDLLHGALDPHLPLANLLLSVAGLDGYYHAVLPTFYKIGEWFVGCILLLYVCFPPLLFLIKRRPRALLCAAGLLFLPWVLWGRPLVPLEQCFVTRLPEFLLGMYFAKYMRRPSRAALLPALPLGVLLWVPLPIPQAFLTCMIGGCLFPVLLYLFGLVRAPRVQTAARALARCSYAVFLVHHVLLDLFFRRLAEGRTLGGLETGGMYLAYLAACLAAGAALYGVGNLWRLKKRAVRV